MRLVDLTRKMAAVLPLVGTMLLATPQALADPMPPEMIDFLNGFQPGFEAMSQNASIDLLGPLNGLWTAEHNDDNQSIDIIYITHIGPYVLEFIVDPATGGLSDPIGYAQEKGAGWEGWFSIGCKGCCPNKFWWDQGVAQVSNAALAIRVDTIKLDPQTCDFTTTPDVVDLRSKLVNAVSFGEFLPGKLISIVASPGVGSQAAQYKAAVKLVWNFTGYGISRIDLVVNGPAGGSQILAGSQQISGDTQYVTDQPGDYRFLLVAYNSAGTPLHFEIESIAIPNIPGIN